MTPSKDSPKTGPSTPADQDSRGTGTPLDKDRELMPRPDFGPDDRPKTVPPPSRDQGRNRSV